MVILLQVRLSFDGPESGLTVVKLTHTNVPEEERSVGLVKRVFDVVGLSFNLL